MRVAQDEIMGMAWSREKEQYEDDCFRAVFGNYVRVAHEKSSYLFSGREMFLEEPASRDQSEDRNNIRGGDSKIEATGNSPIVRQQEIPRSTVHQEHERSTKKQPQDGETRTLPEQRSQGINSSSHQTAYVKRKESVTPPITHDAQNRNAGRASTQNSSQDRAEGTQPAQSQWNRERRPFEPPNRAEWDRERKPFVPPRFTRGAIQEQGQNAGRPLSSIQNSFLTEHDHAVREKGSDSVQAPRAVKDGTQSRNYTIPPRFLNTSTGGQRPSNKNLAGPVPNTGFKSTDTANNQQKSKDIAANKRPKREHHLSASMNNMYDRGKSNVNLKPSKNSKSPPKTANTDPRVVVIKLEGEDCFNITTDDVQCLNVLRRYPSLVKVIPRIGGPEISMQWSSSAVVLVMRHIFEPRGDFERLVKGRIIIEALALASEWGLTDFRTRMTPILLQKLLTQQNAVEFYNTADHFHDSQLCTAIEEQSKHLFGEGTLPRKGTAFRFRSRSCVVSCQFYVDPSEIFIPLAPGSNTLLEENRRDVQCHIDFEAVQGSFAICGFQMAFLVNGKGDQVQNASKLKIDYQLENLDRGCSIMEVKEKPLRPRVILHFKKDFVVREGEKCKLSVESELSPFICYTLKHRLEKGKFQVRFSSNYRAKNDEFDRFFIEKLFFRELP